MADTRYLKRQHQGWYFHMAVPTALWGKFDSEGRHGKPGKPRNKIVKSLGTQSLKVAQERRWPLVQQWREAFLRAATGEPLSLPEIDAEAREVYTSTLERLETDAKTKKLTPAKEAEDLSEWFHIIFDEHVKDDDLYAEEYEFHRPINVDQHIEELHNFDFVADEISAVQRRKGVTLEPGSHAYLCMGRAIVGAELYAIDNRRKALRGEPFEHPATFLGAKGINPLTGKFIAQEQVVRPKIRIRDESGIQFSEAAARYLEELQHDPNAKMTEQTLARHKSIYQLFQDFTDDAPLATIDKAKASGFLDIVAKLHPHWGYAPNVKDMSLDELVERFGKGDKHLSNTTINKYAHSLSALFKWADNRGHFEGRNPFQGQSRKEGEGTGWRAYTCEELNLLFGSELLRAATADQRIRPAKRSMTTTMYWIPLIGLFSGMRLNEICQLQTDDVERKDNVWVFRVSDEGTGQSVKTRAAVRTVPIHSEIIRCGFLDYLDALPDGQLFPALKPVGPDGKFNRRFTLRFTAYRRDCGVNEPRVSFHSFRKNAAQALKDARATSAEIAELIGHDPGFTLSVYAPMQMPISELKELIERIKIPELDLSHLYVAYGTCIPAL